MPVAAARAASRSAAAKPVLGDLLLALLDGRGRGLRRLLAAMVVALVGLTFEAPRIPAQMAAVERYANQTLTRAVEQSLAGLDTDPHPRAQSPRETRVRAASGLTCIWAATSA